MYQQPEHPRLDLASAKFYGSFSPTLLSAIFHMVALIALALLTLEHAVQPGYELTLAATEDLGGEDMGHLGMVDIDISAVEIPAAAAVEFEPVTRELDLQSVASAVEVFEAAMPLDALTPNFGDLVDGIGEGMGSGTGKGNGVGEGLGRTTVFGLAGEGRKFVYVFDRSKSMTSTFRLYDNDTLISELTPLMLAKAEMVRSLQDLSDEDRFQIVFYNERPIVFDELSDLRRLFTATDEKKSEAQQFVVNMSAEGSTNHVDAIKLALRLKPDVVFLITDGEEKDDLTTPQLRSLAKSCKDNGVTVHLVHFAYESRPDSTLVQLAAGTGGQHRFIDIRELAGLGQPGNL